MLEVFEKLKILIQQDTFFWFCALAGSGMFIIQFMLSLVGTTDHDHQLDHGSDTETDSVKVRWLSKQAVSGFLMMFGWAALTCSHQFGLERMASGAIGCGAGMLAVIVNGFIFKMAKKLRSSGTVFKIEDAIGKEAVVYQRIPKGGAGKISISLHQMTHEIDAVSFSEEEISSFTDVQIINKQNGNTVVVVPIKK